ASPQFARRASAAAHACPKEPIATGTLAAHDWAVLSWNSSNDSLVVPARPANPQPAQAEELHFPDPIVAEVVFALESLFGLERARVAELVRAVIDLPSV